MYPYFHGALAQPCATAISYHQSQQQLMALERLPPPFGSQASAALASPASMNFAISAYPSLDPITAATVKAFGFGVFDPRNSRFLQEEPKPQHSYIGLIAMAILSSEEKKMVLCDIYQWILDHYSYFRTRGPGWRNSIRHNLSLNDCFIKAGRSANGKGHYWAIHPANIADFKKGDFRRRRAQRKVRRHMGLTGGDDGEDSDGSLTPSPDLVNRGKLIPDGNDPADESKDCKASCSPKEPSTLSQEAVDSKKSANKRKFDVESLLAPDDGKKYPKSFLPDFTSLNPALLNFSVDLNQASTGILVSPLVNADLQQNYLSAALPPANVPNHPDSMETWLPASGVWVSSQGDNEAVTRNHRIVSPFSAVKWQQSFAKIMARSYHAKDIFNTSELASANTELSPVKETEQSHQVACSQ